MQLVKSAYILQCAKMNGKTNQKKASYLPVSLLLLDGRYCLDLICKIEFQPLC